MDKTSGLMTVRLPHAYQPVLHMISFSFAWPVWSLQSRLAAEIGMLRALGSRDGSGMRHGEGGHASRRRQPAKTID